MSAVLYCFHLEGFVKKQIKKIVLALTLIFFSQNVTAAPSRLGIAVGTCTMVVGIATAVSSVAMFVNAVFAAEANRAVLAALVLLCYGVPCIASGFLLCTLRTVEPLRVAPALASAVAPSLSRHPPILTFALPDGGDLGGVCLGHK